MTDNTTAASRRLTVLSGQIANASPEPSAQLAGLSHSTSLGIERASTSGYSLPNRTVPTSSYERIHGQVSRSPAVWRKIEVVAKEQLQEVIYEKAVGEGIAKIAINRPEKRNAFTPRTDAGVPAVPEVLTMGAMGALYSALSPLDVCLDTDMRAVSCVVQSWGCPEMLEMSWCFADARDDPKVGAIILTGGRLLPLRYYCQAACSCRFIIGNALSDG
eukprot:1136864-Pelagomonas_calceolata.AAC.11